MTGTTQVRVVAHAASTSAVTALGVPLAFLMLAGTESGIPVPVPADLVMLFVGERAADGSFPLWLAVLVFEVLAMIGSAMLFLLARGPARLLITRLGPRLGLTDVRMRRAGLLLVRRGRLALAIGRATPGLRTITVVAASGSGLSLRQSLPALFVGASIFLQLHLFLGYFLGSSADRLLREARGPALIVAALLVGCAIAFWVVRRRRTEAAAGIAQGSCPACLALAALVDRAAGT